MAELLTVLTAVRAVAARQDGVVTRRQVIDAGGTDALLATMEGAGSWVRLVWGTYLVEPDRTPREQERSWARSGQLLVPGAVLSHHTAAVLHGIRGVPRTGAVHVSRRAKALTRPRLVVHRGAITSDDVVDLDGLRVTSPQRTLTDLVPGLDRLAGLAVLDSALRTGAASPADLAAAQTAARGRRGCAVVSDVWSLADRRAASPLESRVRLRCHDAGLVPSDLQLEVRDGRGVLLAVADLAFDPAELARVFGLPPVPPGLPLLVEGDGRRYHGEGDDEDDDERAFAWDRRRQNAVLALGHPVVRFSWGDTLSRGAVPAALRAQVAARAA